MRDAISLFARPCAGRICYHHGQLRITLLSIRGDPDLEEGRIRRFGAERDIALSHPTRPLGGSRKERGDRNRNANKIRFAGCDQLGSRAIRRLDQAILVRGL